MVEPNRQSSLPASGRFKLLVVAFLALVISGVVAAEPKIAGKLTIGHPIIGRFDERSETKRGDSEQPRVAIFQLAFDPNETVTIDAESEQFNAHLRILDAKGNSLLEDDDGGLGHNARLVLNPKQVTEAASKGLYLELTSQGSWDMGGYKISMTSGEETALQGKEKIQADIAYFERAAAVAVANQAYRRQGWVLATLAWNYSLLGRYDQLREQALAAKQIAEKVSDKKLLAFALKNIGAAAWYQGNGKDAVPYFEQALQIRREIGDRKGEANSLDNLGITYQQLNDRQRAIDYFEQSLKICRELDDKRGESNELGNLGIAYYMVGDHNRAIQYYEQALEMRRKVGDRRGEAYDLSNLGVVYAKLGEYPRAITYYELAVKIHRELGDRRGEEHDLENLAKAYALVGEVQRAVEYSKEAERIKQELSSFQ